MRTTVVIGHWIHRLIASNFNCWDNIHHSILVVKQRTSQRIIFSCRFSCSLFILVLEKLSEKKSLHLGIYLPSLAMTYIFHDLSQSQFEILWSKKCARVCVCVCVWYVSIMVLFRFLEYWMFGARFLHTFTRARAHTHTHSRKRPAAMIRYSVIYLLFGLSVYKGWVRSKCQS